MGWNDHQDAAFTAALRQLFAQGSLEPDSREEILARYILEHGFAALSEEQQQRFRDELLPRLREVSGAAVLPMDIPLQETTPPPNGGISDPGINDPGNEDPGSLLESELPDAGSKSKHSR
ncbi:MULTISPECIES: hypothetical protein [Pseudomonas]|jgi:hypothetical protein|uniref:Uncharacterized protein n=1 Tax=Pseudomonas citronellolis TaxID=53408 RepID=A0A1A9KBM1_9PSED|nr:MULTISPECIES: hypothetical protein [Pseudomonas]ANI14945.1 hypothetical protein A9C11_13500 [Pseudomonas citronellolis]KWR75511.1 hypothetical protein RN02_22965 [Pseudomonas sp. PI1]MBB1609077.1 hypothetical protein [Pseudomonas sp. UMC76]MBB1640191.1 hypothetical protein [Pseudomonas sp. UME83]MCP1640431.1 hypothetical protein [Pseudomonas citronellolis]